MSSNTDRQIFFPGSLDSKWILMVLCLMAFAFAGLRSGQLHAQQKLSADAIMDKMLENNALGFRSGQAEAVFVVKDRKGEERIRAMQIRSKQFGDGSKTTVRFTQPKEVKGQSFLFAENTSGDDDVWMYVPAFSVTRRIEGSQKRSSFMGTHFTFADLESRDLKDAQYKRLPDEKIGKFPVYVLEARPTDKAKAAKSSKSPYSRIVVYVRQDDFIPLRIQFFEEADNKPNKTLFVEKIDKTDQGQSYVQQMTLHTALGGWTRLTLKSLNPGVELPDALFSKEQLGR